MCTARFCSSRGRGRLSGVILYPLDTQPLDTLPPGYPTPLDIPPHQIPYTPQDTLHPTRYPIPTLPHQIPYTPPDTQHPWISHPTRYPTLHKIPYSPDTLSPRYPTPRYPSSWILNTPGYPTPPDTLHPTRYPIPPDTLPQQIPYPPIPYPPRYPTLYSSGKDMQGVKCPTFSYFSGFVLLFPTFG